MRVSPSSTAILHDGLSALIWVSLSPHISTPILQTGTPRSRRCKAKGLKLFWESQVKNHSVIPWLQFSSRLSTPPFLSHFPPF